MPDRIVACGQPCHRHGRLCHSLAPSLCALRAVSRVLPRVSQPSAPYRGVLLHRIAAPGCTVLRHKVAPLSATIQLLYRDPAPSRVHCAQCRVRDRPYCGPTTSCRGSCLGCITGRLSRVVAESWPVHARPCATSLPSLSQYSLLYCDSN